MAQLTDRGVIAVSGAEARSFLQGLVTSDMSKVAPGRPAYAALLTPQGKILFDFLVSEADGALLLDCRKEARDALVKKLSLYKLRAKLAIDARDDLMVATEGPDDPRLAALGPRSVVPFAAVEPGDADYLEKRLDLGVPEGADFGSGSLFALDAGLDALNGVAFDKGCYVGQELTARMKHRGTDRKRLLPLATADGSALALAPVTCGGVESGSVTAAYGPRGFALMRLDRLEGPQTVAGVPVTVGRPAWLFS
jgi:tRNA-modifying protein YgfZ